MHLYLVSREASVSRHTMYQSLSLKPNERASNADNCHQAPELCNDTLSRAVVFEQKAQRKDSAYLIYKLSLTPVTQQPRAGLEIRLADTCNCVLVAW